MWEIGCGKTTQILQSILESETEYGRRVLCGIICTQTRWIYAMSVAERVVAERGEKPGESVSYCFGFYLLTFVQDVTTNNFGLEMGL